MTPGLPFVPAIAVTVNVYLIFKLSILTLVRFIIWMSLGEPFTRSAWRVGHTMQPWLVAAYLTGVHQCLCSTHSAMY